MILRIIMEIYAAPKLSKYMAALSAYNIKSLTYEINQNTHIHTHAQAYGKTFTQRKICQRNMGRRLETLLKEMGF